MGSFRSRVVARKKLQAMVMGAAIARSEITGTELPELAGFDGSTETVWGKSTAADS